MVGMFMSICFLKIIVCNKVIVGREGEGRGGVLREKILIGLCFLDFVFV